MIQQKSFKNPIFWVAALCLLSVPVTAMGEYADVILADNPVAYYQMNETGGTTLNDSVGYGGLDGTLVGIGTPTYGVASPITSGPNTAISFAGDACFSVADTYNILDVGTDQDFSIEFWFKTDSVPGQNGVPTVNGFFGKGDTNANVWGRMTSSLMYGLLDYGATYDKVEVSNTYMDDVWHHYVLTADRDSSLALYVDGTKVGEDTDILGGNVSSTFPLMIAQMDNKWFYYGEMDEFAIFPVALTSEQINTHYDAATAVPEPSTIVLLLGGLMGFLYFRRR